jgi:hypothetical protein
MERVALWFRTRQISDPGYGAAPVCAIRVLARARFSLRGPGPDISAAWEAVVDTGAPFGVLPKRVWLGAEVNVLSPDSALGGISRRKACRLPAAFGVVRGRLEDASGKHTQWYPFPVFLAKTNRVPLIIGFAGMLDRLRVVVDYPSGAAWVEERTAQCALRDSRTNDEGDAWQTAHRSSDSQR